MPKLYPYLSDIPIYMPSLSDDNIKAESKYRQAYLPAELAQQLKHCTIERPCRHRNCPLCWFTQQTYHLNHDMQFVESIEDLWAFTLIDPTIFKTLNEINPRAALKCFAKQCQRHSIVSKFIVAHDIKYYIPRKLYSSHLHGVCNEAMAKQIKSKLKKYYPNTESGALGIEISQVRDRRKAINYLNKGFHEASTVIDGIVRNKLRLPPKQFREWLLWFDDQTPDNHRYRSNGKL